MTTPDVPLVAHFNDATGKRIKSLRVVAITEQSAMLVLWDSRLQPAVAIKGEGFTFDRVEYLEEPKKAKKEAE